METQPIKPPIESPEDKLQKAEQELANVLRPENVSLAEEIMDLEENIYKQFSYSDHRGKKGTIDLERLGKEDPEGKLLYESTVRIKEDKTKRLLSNLGGEDKVSEFVHRLYSLYLSTGNAIQIKKFFTIMSYLGVDKLDLEKAKAIRLEQK